MLLFGVTTIGGRVTVSTSVLKRLRNQSLALNLANEHERAWIDKAVDQAYEHSSALEYTGDTCQLVIREAKRGILTTAKYEESCKQVSILAQTSTKQLTSDVDKIIWSKDLLAKAINICITECG